MSKKISIFLLIATVTVGGYWVAKKISDGSIFGSADSTLLQRVPAETVLFVGGPKVIPYANPYSATATKNLHASLENQLKQLEVMTAGHKSPATTIAINLYMDMISQFSSDNMTEMNDFAVYALGIYPVAVWQSKDVNTFVSKLNKIEKDNSITARTFNLGNAELREYLIDDKAPVKMYVAINDNTVSVSAMKNNQALLKLLAGVDFPEQNLANSNKLQDLIAKHNLLAFGMGYFDVNSAMTSLASSEDNLLKQTLLDTGEVKDISELTSDTCFTDAAKIIARWPRMIFGYRMFDYKSNPIVMDAAMIFEHTDSKFLDSLKSILGSLPEFSMESDMLSFGLGINADNIAIFLGDLRKDIMRETYQCNELIKLQKEVAQNDLAAFTMSTQMVAGVQGVSLHVAHVDAAAVSAGDMSKFEGMAVITANNPEKLIAVAGNFYPPLAQMQIEANGEAQVLSLPTGLKADMAMSEKAITLQLGGSEELKSRAADIHQGKGLSTSLLRSGMDFSSYFKMITPLISESLAQTSPKDAEQMKKMVELFESLKMKFVYGINVEDSGIAIKLKGSINNDPK